MRCEAAAVRPSGRRPTDRSGTDKGTPAIGARPDSVTRCGRTIPDSVDQWGEAATSASAHPIGTGAVGQWTRN
jgi:hypothetical protein